MENTYVISQTDGRGREDSFYSLGAEWEPSGADGLISSESNSKLLVQRLNPECTLNLSFNQLQTRKNSVKDPYCQSTGGIDCTIPRHVVNLDEKYLRRFLELIHISASKAATRKISVNYSSGMEGILAGGSNPAETKGEGTFDTARFVFECPLVDEVGCVAIRPAGRGIVGSVIGSKSMVNLLKSPLYCQFGSSDGEVKLRKTDSGDDKAMICYNFMNSPGGLSDLSSPQQVKQAPISDNHKFGSGFVDKRLASVSSTKSTCPDQSSAASSSVSQGMLQCTWRGSSPCFVFSVDGKNEVYVANLSKVDSADGKALDYVYLLHSTKGGRKAHEICDVESALVGKIEVSSCFTIGPNNSKIKETEFVLYGNKENHTGEMQTSSHSLGKTKALSKKVVDVFRTSHSSKQRTMSKFSGYGAILENCSSDPHQDTSNMCDELGDVDLLEKHLPPNFELAAIVVKYLIPDSFSDNRQREAGGWGLKFLKNTGIKKTIDSLAASVTSECYARNTGDCSTSMDILLPAGIHGGPRTRHGGPSSLIDRWKWGCCDCGGWDMDCPLTVLNTGPNIEAGLHNTDTEGKCKTIDLFIKASEQSAPTLRMVNIHEGLYCINFQSVLSALQSFSIAVAFMHTRSPNFNMYRS